MPSSETDNLPVLWLEPPATITLPIGAGVEPVSMAVSATLASLILFVLFVLHVRRSRFRVLYPDVETVDPKNDAQAAVEDAACEDELSHTVPVSPDHTFEASKANNGGMPTRLKRQYEEHSSNTDVQINDMIGDPGARSEEYQTPQCQKEGEINSTEDTLSISNYSASETCAENDGDNCPGSYRVPGGTPVHLELGTGYEPYIRCKRGW